jgi:hypothetical protein
MASDQFPPRLPYDQENPYAAPRADVGPEKFAYGAYPIPPEIGPILTRTWEIYKDQVPMCVGVWLACVALNFGVQMGIQLLEQAAGQAVGQSLVLVLTILALTLGVIVFQVWINIGLGLFMIGLGRGDVTPFETIFNGGRYLLPVILASILFFLIVLGVIGACLIPGGLALAALGTNSNVGWGVLIVFGIVAVVAYVLVAIRLSQFYYLILDRNLGVLDSLRVSIQITKGNELTIFVIYLLTVPITFLGLLICLVGVIFAVPFTTLMVVVMYLALAGRSGLGAEDEPLAELELI